MPAFQRDSGLSLFLQMFLGRILRFFVRPVETVVEFSRVVDERSLLGSVAIIAFFTAAIRGVVLYLFPYGLIPVRKFSENANFDLLSQPQGGLILAEIAASLFFFPIFYYGLAWILHLGCLLFGGLGTAQKTRAIVFISTLLLLPFVLLKNYFSIIHGVIGREGVKTLFSWIGLLDYVSLALIVAISATQIVLISYSLARVHQFSSGLKVSVVFFLIIASTSIFVCYLAGSYR